MTIIDFERWRVALACRVLDHGWTSGEVMSSLELTCPHCDQRVTVSDEFLGRSVDCPVCEFRIDLSDTDVSHGSGRGSPSAPASVLRHVPVTSPGRATRSCPFCGEEILSVARKCKHCGEFLDASLKPQRQVRQTSRSAAGPVQRMPGLEATEYKAHPSMFRNNPLGFILSVALIAAVGLGLLILLVWWLRCLGTTLTVTNKRTILRRGILSKYTTEVYHSDVRNVQVDQSMFQRIFGVGTIGISSAGQSGIEITVSGVAHPADIKGIIDEQRRL